MTDETHLTNLLLAAYRYDLLFQRALIRELIPGFKDPEIVGSRPLFQSRNHGI